MIIFMVEVVENRDDNTKRCYKNTMPLEKAYAIIRDENPPRTLIR